MSSSKSSFPFDSTSLSIFKSPANSSKSPRCGVALLHAGFLLFRKRSPTWKVFLAEDRVPGALHYSAHKGKHRPTALTLLSRPPPTETEQWSSPLCSTSQRLPENFQVARQVQRSAGVYGGTNEKAAQTPSTNQRPDFTTVLYKAILATFTMR